MVANLRHLQAFCEVARLRSISAASRSVHLSQPALTQAVASVERYFGAPLFNRSNAGMSATEAGGLCAERIDRAMRQLREGVAEVTRPAQREAGLERSMTVAQLHALSAVVEQGNFSLAARALRVSAPTIHRAARDLERRVGVALFESTSFGIRPTREAERLARRAKLAFAEIAQARAEVHALAGGETGSTVIGAMPLARSFLVPKALIEFAAEHSQHGVSIVEGPYEHLVSSLRSAEVDFLVGALRESQLPGELVQEHLFDDPLGIIMRAGHPLARRRRVSVATLAKFPWVAPRIGSPLRNHFNELFRDAGVVLQSRPIDCNSLIAARSLLLESDRIMLLSAHQIHYELEAGLLTVLPHPGGRVTRPIGITARRDWQPTACQRRLIELLRLRAHSRAALRRRSAPGSRREPRDRASAE